MLSAQRKKAHAFKLYIDDSNVSEFAGSLAAALSANGELATQIVSVADHEGRSLGAIALGALASRLRRATPRASLGVKLSEESNRRAIVTVHFATDRKRVPDANRLFGSERGPLTLGRADVSIPGRHRLGRVERPQLWKFEWREDPRKHVVIAELSVLSPEDFSKSVGDNSKTGLLFIHGYNVTFDAAIRRAAQLKWDMQFPGPAFAYSWPSLAQLSLYSHDAAVVQRAVRPFRAFLKHLERTGIERLHVVAHSMGNRLLLEALQHADSKGLLGMFGEVVFAAPDVDQDVFRDAVRYLARRSTPMTLYATSYDRALQASRVFNGAPRAGDSGSNLVLAAGLDTVDISSAAQALSLNHGTFGDSPSLLADLHELLPDGKRPPRMFLARRELRKKRYWELKV